MKIRKPEDEKFFKDVVLKDILEEISNEDEIRETNTVKLKKRKSYYTLLTKTIFFIVITTILTLFSILLFSLVTDATQEEKPTSKGLEVIMPKETTQEWKMEEDRAGYIKTIPHKTETAKHIPQKETLSKTIEIKAVKSKPLPKKKTEHELAKEALRQQMLN